MKADPVGSMTHLLVLRVVVSEEPQVLRVVIDFRNDIGQPVVQIEDEVLHPHHLLHLHPQDF